MIAWNFQRIVGTCQFRVPWFGYPCGYSSLTFENINFNRIKRIYDFDGRIRNLIFECIETIELYLRTQLAYYCGHTCGSLGYLNPDIYNEKYNDEKCIF